MKPIKRATCPLCNFKKNTSDGKTNKEGLSTTLKCPKDGSPLRLSTDWYIRIQVNGKSEYKPCGSRKADADAFIAACLLAKRAGTAIPGQERDVTWKEAVANCEGWWDKALERKEIKQSTRDHYKNQIIVLNKYFYGHTLLTITKATVQDMMLAHGKDHAPATVVHAYSALKRMYTLHIDNLDLENNPRPKLIEKSFIIARVPTPKFDNTVTASADSVDIHKILHAIECGRGKNLDKQRLRLAILLGLGMLLRPANINALQWSQVDLVNGVIKIDNDTMKGGRNFEAPIPTQIIEELKAWRRDCGVVSPNVFPSPQDPAIPMKKMCQAITRWIKKTGLNPDGVTRKEKITQYVLTRHTGATELYEESGENLEMVSKTADHADSRITRKRYVKNRVEHAKRTVIPIQDAMLRRMTGIKDAA